MIGSQCHTESQTTSWWQPEPLRAPQLCLRSGCLTYEVRNRLPPTGEGSILQQCPSQFTALFIRAFWLSSKWELSASHFPKVIGKLSSGTLSSLFQDQEQNQARQWGCVCVCGRALCLPIRSRGEEWPPFSYKEGVYGLQKITSQTSTLKCTIKKRERCLLRSY